MWKLPAGEYKFRGAYKLFIIYQWDGIDVITIQRQ